MKKVKKASTGKPIQMKIQYNQYYGIAKKDLWLKRLAQLLSSNYCIYFKTHINIR